MPETLLGRELAIVLFLACLAPAGCRREAPGATGGAKTALPTVPGSSATGHAATGGAEAAGPRAAGEGKVSEPSMSAQPVSEQVAAEVARRFMGLMAEKKYDQAEGMFSAKMKSLMPAAKIKEVWEKVMEQVGTLDRELGLQQQLVKASRVVDVTCAFGKAPLDVRVTVNAESEVEGLFFRPASAQAAESAGPPPYVRREAFTERELSVGQGELALPGTLTLPLKDGGKAPAVVLVHGSGPNDRDETVGGHKPFRDIAWGLASQGVAVLRYDKRTKVHAPKLKGVTLTLKEDTIDDALAAVATLQRTDGIDPDRIFVLGHSLGGMALPRIGRGNDRIAGLVFLAASNRPLEEMIVDQLNYIIHLKGKPTAEEIKALEAAREAANVIKGKDLSPKTPRDRLPLKVPASYWLYLRSYDPLREVAGLRTGLRMLFIQGGRDYQVTLKDFEGWKKALARRTGVSFKLFPRANHLMSEGEGPSEPAEYMRPGHVAPAVIEEIVAFVK